MVIIERKQDQISISETYYNNFKNSCKSIETFQSYNYKLNAYMRYRKYTEYYQLIDGRDPKVIESEVIDFIVNLKNKGYSYGSQRAYLNSLTHFYDINDVLLNHKKINRFMSDNDSIITTTETSIREDKAYNHQQISKLLDFSDIRTKAMILLMASSGLRIGALPLLRVGHLVPVGKYSIYQITAYANSKKYRHHTFCTSECRKTIDDYLSYRKQCGEHITDKSPLLRREFDRNDIFQVANDIRPLSRSAIKKSLTKVLYASGLRTPLVAENIKRLNSRRDVAMAHGFRKFFDTTCTNAGMNPIYIEFCEGHSLKGVKDSYFIPRADKDGIYTDILEGNNDKSLGYISAINALTINEENRLRKEIEILKVEKSEIDKLKEEVEEFRRIKPGLAKLNEDITKLKRAYGR